MENSNNQPKNVVEDLARLYGLHARSIEKAGNGKNSQVYHVLCENDGQFIVKYYFRNKLDNRDRLKVEFSSFRFLWDNGIRCIPKPVMADDESATAIYTYIHGSKPSMDDISDDDIRYAASFLSELSELRNADGNEGLSIASEACFSFNELLGNLNFRIDRLMKRPGDEVLQGPFHEFLQNDFLSAFSQITEWCRESFLKKSISPECLATAERTLSPSDFGFHNCVRAETGEIFFLDFEYFGWDDPAKTISDFILHPAMALTEEQKNTFYSSILHHFGKYRNLDDRVEIYYPLYGLKWCLIFLNEFLPDQMLRRKFAGCVGEKEVTILEDQLLKSRNMLKNILKEYKQFPYKH